MQKTYITPQQLLKDAYALGTLVFESGFRPRHIIGIWRGGTPVAIAVHELLHMLGVESDHFAIRTRSYRGMGKRNNDIRVDGLEYFRDQIGAGDDMLIVDDVHDTGLSSQQVAADLHKLAGGGQRDIRIATPYYKPTQSRSARAPDYYLHETDNWLVFPHELDGLTLDEMRQNKPELAAALPLLMSHLQGSSE